LLNVKGATSFKEILKKEDGSGYYSNFTEACLGRRLIYDDQEWFDCLKEANEFKMPHALRFLFVNILIHGMPTYPLKLWEKFKENLSQDFIYNGDKKELAYQKAYAIIASKINQINWHGRNFKYFVDKYKMPNCTYNEDDEDDRMPDPIKSNLYDFLLILKLGLDKGQAMYNNMKEESKVVVNAIRKSCKSGDKKAKCFYLDGPGGTGKTYAYTTLYHMLSGEKIRVQCMASTGIAAILCPKGKTVHSRFALGPRVGPDSTSPIKLGTKASDILVETEVFIWDEVTMSNKYIFKIVDEKLRELMDQTYPEQGYDKIPFGGKIMLLGGDFRQCLPVQRGANRSEKIDLSIKRSYLWKHFKGNIFKLKENARAKFDPEFAKFVLQVIIFDL